MRHVFLTGDTRLGKTTLLNALLALHPAWRVGGFRTYLYQNGVYLAPADAPQDKDGLPDAPRDEQSRVGLRGKPPVAFPAAFDALGASLLSPAGKDVLLMDELGFLERDAQRFQCAVLHALDGSAPVLGVLKPLRTPFLDRVRAHPDVRVLAVTRENRDELMQTVLSQAAFFPPQREASRPIS